MSVAMAVCTWVAGIYLAVAGAAFWTMASYEHMGGSGWRSLMSKRSGEIRSLASIALAWLPLLVRLVARRAPGR